MKRRMILILSAWVLMLMACNLGSAPPPTPTRPVAPAPPGATAVPVQPQASPTPVPPDPLPVSINDGLTSLNSYQMTILFRSAGPDPSASSTTMVERKRSTQANSSYTHINLTSTGKGESSSGNTDSEIYQIGNDQCSGNPKDWTWSSATPAQAEMAGLVTSMVGMTPLIDHPVFVAAETVNDIPTNHFSFQVSGLGSTSGAVVNLNQGDYWLAIDGQYIVKYVLVVETTDSSTGDVLHEEVSIELTQVNQPVDITFPQGCLDASQVTPNP